MSAFAAPSLRRTIVRMAHAGQSVHVPCALSLVEILAVLYRKYLRFDRSNPRSPERDYLVLSKGHGVMAQYACLHELGWIDDGAINGYFGEGTRLKGLSDAHVPGLEVSSGSLGHGLSVGVGLALAAQRAGTDQRCYCIVGDGEMNEGSMWEALLFAAHFHLGNLIVIVDQNGQQAMGRTREVMDLGDLTAKFTAFGFISREVEGHDESALDQTLAELIAIQEPRPRALIAKTVKGKGVSFMEDDNRWHYTRLNQEMFTRALTELEGVGS